VPAPTSRTTWLTCGALFLALAVVYNANGREIGGSDSQPTKFAARALALRGNLRLDEDVRRLPLLAERASFAKDLKGRYRSAYSPVGAMFGGVTAVVLRALGADLEAPRAPNLIAVITASALTAAAVCLVFLTLSRLVSRGLALAVAIGLGAGTNFWALHSQTMAQHDVVVFGLALALFNWTRPNGTLERRHLWMGAIGLALAVTARTQVVPLVGLMGLGLLVRVGWRRALGPLALAVGLLAVLLATQWRWFGHPLGAMPMLESLHPDVHAVSGSLGRDPWIGAAGLLVSPSRGLFVYSPVAIIALLGIVPALRSLREHGLGWALAGAFALYVGYSLYAVWWGGHSYGPRYMLDLIVVLTVPAAVALERVLCGRAARALSVVALVWSVVATGTGAFFADTWNTQPASVDRHHERLWDWHDPQILRAWQSGLHPQNFNLFNDTIWRRDP
jgi:hypothetical protein